MKIKVQIFELRKKGDFSADSESMRVNDPGIKNIVIVRIINRYEIEIVKSGRIVTILLN